MGEEIETKGFQMQNIYIYNLSLVKKEVHLIGDWDALSFKISCPKQRSCY